ncbi:MAG: SPOR domain-containing protein, partial [Flavobacteriales bacterium]
EVTTDKTKEITYHKSEFNGNYLIILNSFEDITIANAEVQNYISEGYKCDVFQLSAVSDSKEEIFQTYIGPFNKLQEANQYLNSTISIKESGKVIELQ